jgi:hypothetical protein
MIRKDESDILRLSIKDFFTSDILKIAILPFVFTMIFVYISFFSLASFGLDQLDNAVIETHSSTLGTSTDVNDNFADDVFSMVLKSTIVTWLVNFLVYTIGSFAMIYVSVFISIIVIGFLTPYILSKIRNKHYSHINMHGDANLISPLFALMKYGLVMLFMLIIFIPLYFIPIIGLIVFNLPIFYFFHKMLNYDVASTILSSTDIRKFKYVNEKKLRLRSLLLFLLSMIPFMSLILPVFYIVYIGHGYFSTLENENF